MSSKLRAVAYRMLGSFAEAEEVVQEAEIKFLKLERSEKGQARSQIHSKEAYMTRIVVNLCVDRLRRLKLEREHYSGPWLPDLVADDVFDDLALAEDLTLGMLLLLENLSPAERITYVLREAFDYSYAEVADVLDTAVANARQRMTRARARLRGQPQPEHLPDAECKALLEQMIGYIEQGDIAALTGMLAEDVVALTDGGGIVSAAIAPVYGADRIAQVTLFLAQKAMSEEPTSLAIERVNGAWAVVMRQADGIHSVSLIEGRDGQVSRIYVMRNPEKLAAISQG